ncbi:hypothetical protein WA026_011354 [Henosepilachna vigintioctopunctata]|uniref:acid phosphatase n=1 Tax=Henosepilachna vigintioctopunctata TaxID=420089 RepID=A0AAW1TLP9_9CUCU
MHCFKIIILIFSLLNLCRTEDELIAVTALIRHGTRIPQELYPLDPYHNYSWPFAMGDLTNQGIGELYNVGRWLRMNYDSFLSREYDVNEIYAQSVDYDRCVMSGEATLAGLYPPRSFDIWNKNIQWQPVPLHISPLNQDFVLNMNTCPKIPEQSALIRTTQIYKNIMAKYGTFFDYISKKSGQTINFSNMYPLFDTLFGEMKMHLPLPTWAQETMPLMNTLIVQYTKMDSMTMSERRIQVGALLTRIIKQFDKAIDGRHFGTSSTIYRKFMAYFTSEWVHYDLTYALGLPSIHIPDFGVQYYIELRKNQVGRYYVNILYRKATSMATEAVAVPMNRLNVDIDYNDFKNYTKPYLVANATEWVNLCEKFTGATVQVHENVPSS